MAKLNDTQSVLLSTASQREGGSLYPLPTTIKQGAALAKAIADLVSKGFAEERETSDRAKVTRQDGDLRVGLFATSAGLTAIGLCGQSDETESLAMVAPPKVPSKSVAIVALMSRDIGATLLELIDATGWLPHTTRAALTGLRKKGHSIERGKRGTDTCYRIVAAA